MKLVETKESKLLTDPLAVAQQEAQTAGNGEGLWDAVRGLMSLQQKAPPLRPVTALTVKTLSFSEDRLWHLWHMQPNGAESAFYVSHRRGLEFRGITNIAGTVNSPS
jgi:hypothetical protein